MDHNNDSEIESNGRKARQGGGFEGPTDEKCSEYIKKLLNERDSLNPERYPTILALIQKELDQMSKGAQGISQDNGYIDLYNDTPITLYVKALPPTKIFPKFNYAGRIIGPKGTYLKALMKETMTKMILLGKGVMKDKDKEEQLRSGTDPKYYHLNEDMHVAIQVTGPASEAYAKISYALKCLKQQVLSDNRGLEDLPWITGPGVIAPGGIPRQIDSGLDPGMVKHHRQHSPPPGPTRQSSSSSASRSTYPPRNNSYDYQEEAYQYSYDYPREPSPTPGQHSSSGKSPYYTSPSYVRRPPPQQPESSRAMDYTDKVRVMRSTHSSHPHTTHGSTRSSSPGMRAPSYDYGHGGGSGSNMYEPDPTPHYYETDGRSGSWSSSDLYPSKQPSMDRGGRSSWSSSQSQRYAPYSKK